MENDPSREWQRLTRVYGEMSDEELLDLAAGFSDLTEVAQPILRDEMKKRGLGEPTPQAIDPGPFAKRSFGAEDSASVDGESSEQSDEDEVPRAYLCECEGSDQVNQLQEALRQAGVESYAEGLRSAREFDTCAIYVPGDQLALAREVASRPIPQEIVEESRIPVEDFAPPTCPKCGAEDPLLESVDPTNTWRCDNCGATWSDSAAFDSAQAERR